MGVTILEVMKECEKESLHRKRKQTKELCSWQWEKLRQDGSGAAS
jgi:hypothetical protein